MVEQNSLPRNHDNSFPDPKDFSVNLFFIMKSTILQGMEVWFTGSSSPWAPLQSLRFWGITLAVHQLSDTMAVCRELTNHDQQYPIHLFDLVLPMYFLDIGFNPLTHAPWGMYPMWECLQHLQQWVHQEFIELFCYAFLTLKPHVSMRSLLYFPTNSLVFFRCT